MPFEGLNLAEAVTVLKLVITANGWPAVTFFYMSVVSVMAFC